MEKNNKAPWILVSAVAAALALFLVLYWQSLIPVEPAGTGETADELSHWTVEDSALNGLPLAEDKTIYPDTPDASVHDVYISVFPTKDEEGNILDFSAFGKHVSRDHTYNPVLNCNVQILEEGESLDPLAALDTKNATIRVRGNSSRGDLYKSYKVKLSDEAETFDGQDVLNLNKHSEDITKIATKLETDLLTDIPDTASYRTYFMRVFIRDASLPKEQQKFRYYGLYTHIEQPNKSYLERRSLSGGGSLYKARDFSFRLADVLKDVDDLEYDEERFETVLSIREGDDHKKLLEMLEAVNDTSRNFEDIFYQYFQEDNYLTWLAFQLLMGNQDIINHNFMLYNPLNSNTWYFISWDFDGTLQFPPYESSLMKLPDSLKGIQKLNQSVLHRRYLRMDGSIEKLQSKMEELLERYITRDRVEQYVDLYRPVVEQAVTYGPDLELLEMSPDAYSEYLNHIYDGILGNYEAFCKALQYPAPMYLEKPRRSADGSVHIAWEPSYSYQGYAITYNVSIYKDYLMTDLVAEKRNVAETACDIDAELPAGTYYLKVTAVDSQGHEQLSMERFETMLTETRGYNVNGLLEFQLD